MFFDFWVKLYVEMWFLPYKIIGGKDEFEGLANLCKPFSSPPR
jgi:hypothetical protein